VFASHVTLTHFSFVPQPDLPSKTHSSSQLNPPPPPLYPPPFKFFISFLSNFLMFKNLNVSNRLWFTKGTKRFTFFPACGICNYLSGTRCLLCRARAKLRYSQSHKYLRRYLFSGLYHQAVFLSSYSSAAR
jgi:hypothetical protein